MEYTYSDFFKIEELRKQCRVWHDEDDDELIMFCEAAIELASAEINRDIYPTSTTLPEYDECARTWPIHFNKKLRAAILLITSDLYENRESQLAYSVTENRTLKLLLDPMRFTYVRLA